MGATIVVCPCGARLKASGLAPGVRGRCPGCGRLISLPEGIGAAEPAEPEVEDEWNWKGTYALDDPEPPPALRADADAVQAQGELPVDATAGPVGMIEGEYALGAQVPPATSTVIAADELADAPVMPARLAPARPKEDDATRARPDPWFPPRLLYPARGAEGMAMAAALGFAFWIIGTLLPEYCLRAMADADMLGATSMGYLVVLISTLPALIMSPIIVIYALQYLGRVLVASADGETRPPRPSDRNLEGLLVGLEPWPLWVVLGLVPALLPLAGCLWTAGAAASPWPLAAAAMAGFPYALMALLMGFLHDEPLAATPVAVIGTLARLLPSFVVLCVVVVLLLASGPAVFAAVLTLRNALFYIYLFAALPCWMATFWLVIVAFHTLGSYVAIRRDTLKWRRERNRWGVRWSL